MPDIPITSAAGPLSDHEVNRLATYNAEVARGLLHTPEWADEMVALQRRFDEHGYVSAERDRLIDKFLGPDLIHDGPTGLVSALNNREWDVERDELLAMIERLLQFVHDDMDASATEGAAREAAEEILRRYDRPAT